MMSPSLSDISDAWFAFHRAHDESGDYAHRTNAGEEFFWVIEYLGDVARHEPQACWDAISFIWARTDENDMARLASLAAGPLEDLLASHGEVILPWIEQMCLTKPRFKILLRGVWQNAIAANVWDRINQLSSPTDHA